MEILRATESMIEEIAEEKGVTVEEVKRALAESTVKNKGVVIFIRDTEKFPRSTK